MGSSSLKVPADVSSSSSRICANSSKALISSSVIATWTPEDICTSCTNSPSPSKSSSATKASTDSEISSKMFFCRSSWSRTHLRAFSVKRERVSPPNKCRRRSPACFASVAGTSSDKSTIWASSQTSSGPRLLMILHIWMGSVEVSSTATIAVSFVGLASSSLSSPFAAAASFLSFFCPFRPLCLTLREPSRSNRFSFSSILALPRKFNAALRNNFPNCSKTSWLTGRFSVPCPRSFKLMDFCDSYL
mmetsp:Transcript_109316/g.233621  ORF Transcript_109316/g.233621 Transcript_109316/m.233621 type:complete len:247 (-) Transcript_109316:259-999(-)